MDDLENVLWPWWGMLLNTSGKGFIHPTGESPNSGPRLLLSLSFPWESCNDSCGVEGLFWNVLSNMAGLGYVHSSGHDGWPRGYTSFRVGKSWKPQMVGRGGQSFVRFYARRPSPMAPPSLRAFKYASYFNWGHVWKVRCSRRGVKSKCIRAHKLWEFEGSFYGACSLSSCLIHDDSRIRRGVLLVAGGRRMRWWLLFSTNLWRLGGGGGGG